MDKETIKQQFLHYLKVRNLTISSDIVDTISESLLAEAIGQINFSLFSMVENAECTQELNSKNFTDIKSYLKSLFDLNLAVHSKEKVLDCMVLSFILDKLKSFEEFKDVEIINILYLAIYKIRKDNGNPLNVIEAQTYQDGTSVDSVLEFPLSQVKLAKVIDLYSISLEDDEIIIRCSTRSFLNDDTNNKK